MAPRWSKAKVVPPPGLGGGNLAAPLVAASTAWPKRLMVTHEGRGTTYGEGEERSAKAAALLRRHGVVAGDRVGLRLPNVPAFLDFYFAILRLGAVVVPMNPLLKAGEVDYALEDSGAELLVSWHEAEAPGSGPDLVVVPDPGAEDLLAGEEVLSEVAEVDPGETAVILYTSGTTGRPKGAELTHHNLGLNTRETIAALSISADDVLLGILPLYHSFGQTCVLNAGIAMGARIALLTRFEEREAARLIKAESVSVLMAVPTMFAALTSVADDPSSFASLRVCVSGGAPLPREQADEFERATGATILESYGLSETSPATALSRPGAGHRPGSVGKPIPGVEVRILDDGGDEVPAGAIGQIAIRGHNVMKGYWRRQEATELAITEDGWFLTGDLGRIDEEGFLYVVGRLKEMIIRGGLNVYPREVEEVLHDHPDVLEAAVLGFPDGRLGEEVAAAVVLREGSALLPEELRDWVKARVAPYKYPRLIWSVAELPKGPTGKILKREISVPTKQGEL